MDQDRSLVGREGALATADAALVEAVGGAGQLLLVSGEPGIGKSALLAEVARRATARGARVLRSVCWDGEVSPPYWPWTQVLRAVDRAEVQLGPAARLLDTAAGWSPDGPAPALQFEMFDAVARVLAALSTRTPAVVVLDDLQWADDRSLELLSFLRAQLAAERVLLLGAYRDTEVVALPGLGTAPVLRLDGLGVEAAAALVRRAGGPQAPVERAEEIRRRCGGNPFFMREMCRLRAGDGIPDGVRDVLRQRLGQLTEACTAMLTTVSVAGKGIELEVVARASGRTVEEISGLIDEAVTARVLVVDGPGLAFVHDLYREALLADCPSTRLAGLHTAVGSALRESGPQLPTGDRLSRLAAHFVATGRAELADEAVQYSEHAAREATARLGHEDACRHYEEALQVIASFNPPVATARRANLLAELGAARARIGRTESARSAFEDAVRLGRAEGEWEVVTRAVQGLYGLAGRDPAEYITTIALLEETVDALAAWSGGNQALRSSAFATLARARRHADSRRADPQAVAAATRAVELAADPQSRAEALLALHDVHWGPGRASQRLPVLDDMLGAATRAGDRELVAVAHQLRATALIELGHPDGRLELERYAHLTAALGHARGRFGALTRRATLAQIAGRVEEAVELSAEALALGSAIGEPDVLGCFTTLRASLMSIGGPEVVLETAPPEDDPTWPVFPLLWALAPALKGRDAEAAALLGDFAVQDVLQKYDLEVVALAATVVAAVGTDAQRTWAYDLLTPFTGTHVVVGGCAAYNGPVDHLLGVLAAALGRRCAAAAAHLTAAVAQCDRLGAAAWSRRSSEALTRLQAGSTEPVVERDGGTWRLAYRGRVEHLPDFKGLRDLAVLIAAPGQDVHVFTLLSRRRARTPCSTTGRSPATARGSASSTARSARRPGSTTRTGPSGSTRNARHSWRS